MSRLPPGKKFTFYKFVLSSPATGKRKVETYAPSVAAAQKTTGAYPDERVSLASIPDQGFRDLQCPRKVKTKIILAFYETLRRYLRSGSPLTDGVVAAGYSSRSPLLRGICGDVALQLGQGLPLSQSLDEYREIFGVSELAAIEAAEESGEYDEIFAQIIHNLQRKDKVIAKLKSAMVYPIVMLTAALGALAFIQIKVYPIFRKQFEKFDFEMPPVTQFAMDASEFLEDYPIVAIIPVAAFLALIFGWKKWWTYEKFQKGVLFFPVIGKAIRFTMLTRALLTLSLLLRAGISDTRAYMITSRSCGAILFEKYFLGIREEVGKGTDPDRAFMLNRGKIGPEGWEISAQMRIANIDGDSQSALRRVAQDFDFEAERLAETLPELLKPTLVALVFAIIGTGVISVLLPNFSMLVQVLQN